MLNYTNRLHSLSYCGDDSLSEAYSHYFDDICFVETCFCSNKLKQAILTKNNISVELYETNLQLSQERFIFFASAVGLVVIGFYSINRVSVECNRYIKAQVTSQSSPFKH